MNVLQVKFASPVRVGAKQLSSVNLLGEDKGKYILKFEAGLLTLVDIDPKNKLVNAITVGLANIVYMAHKVESVEKVTTKKKA